MSSEALGSEIDLDAVVDRSFVGDVGLPASAELLAFTNAVETGDSDLPVARQTLIAAVGGDGLLEAAATIAVFYGLVRVADGTGIPLDAGLQAFSRADRERLGLDQLTGAANTTDPVEDRTVQTIGQMFG